MVVTVIATTTINLHSSPAQPWASPPIRWTWRQRQSNIAAAPFVVSVNKEAFWLLKYFSAQSGIHQQQHDHQHQLSGTLGVCQQQPQPQLSDGEECTGCGRIFDPLQLGKDVRGYVRKKFNKLSVDFNALFVCWV
jgi:hypothetical protein